MRLLAQEQAGFRVGVDAQTIDVAAIVDDEGQENRMSRHLGTLVLVVHRCQRVAALVETERDRAQSGRIDGAVTELRPPSSFWSGEAPQRRSRYSPNSISSTDMPTRRSRRSFSSASRR